MWRQTIQVKARVLLSSVREPAGILTPWFFHPVSLWHWDHRRAAWQKWLSAWCGPSAGQTFPVLCGEGIRTSVAIPVRGERERDSGLHSITTIESFLHLLESREETKHNHGKQDDKWQNTLKAHPGGCAYILKVCSDNTWVNHLQQCFPLCCCFELASDYILSHMQILIVFTLTAHILPNA